jgi:putative sterol carrier protein
MTEDDGTAAMQGVDEAQLVQVVAGATDQQLEELMASEARKDILDDIFRRMAEHVDPDRARDVSAVLHWKIFDRPDGGYDHYEVVLEGGACSVSETPSREPAVTLKLKPADFLKLVSGNASGPTMFMTGRLKLEGDVMLASRLTSMFQIPKAAA